MNRQYRAVALLCLALVVAFVASLALHSLVAAVTVLFAALAVSFVLGIAWMRTRHKSVPASAEREKQPSLS